MMIGVFDSGVGGLSVLRSIAQRLPYEDLLYVADTAYMPYGEKPDEVILGRSLELSRLMLKQGAKALVVACNTATAVAIAEMRREFSVPIVGIEPALKPARGLSKTGTIGILATRSTLQSQKFQTLLNVHGENTRVLTQACPEWVELVERGDLSSGEALEVVSASLNPLIEQGVDTVVLGCTHFPFLQPLIRHVAPELQIIEPSLAVAAQLERVLTERNLLTPSASSRNVSFLTTGNLESLALHLQSLWQGADCSLEALSGESLKSQTELR